MKYYMVVLAGMGDIWVKIVDEPTWNDIFAGPESDNDKALEVEAAVINGEEFFFTSVNKALKAIKKAGIKLENDEYEGYIY